MIRIESADPTDAAKLAELQATTFRQAYSAEHTQENIEQYCAHHYTTNLATQLLCSDYTVEFGFVDDVLSGYYVLTQPNTVEGFLEGSSHKAWHALPELKQIYVLQSAYGQGLGPALFKHALQVNRLAGHKGLWLCVSDLNLRAQAFYSKLGFLSVERGPVLAVGSDRLPSSIFLLEF